MKIGSIVIRRYEFEKMLAFWQQALHYVARQPAKNGWVVLCEPEGRGPNLSLDRDPSKRPGKRSRLHLDLYTNDKQSEAERLVKLGATRYHWRYKPRDDFIVLEDPDGNLFCVVQVPTESCATTRTRPHREGRWGSTLFVTSPFSYLAAPRWSRCAETCYNFEIESFG